MAEHLSWIIPLIASSIGGLMITMISVIVWAVRLEGKILYIEAQNAKDRLDLKEWMQAIIKTLEEIRKASAQQYTKTAVLEERIQELKNEQEQKK